VKQAIIRSLEKKQRERKMALELLIWLFVTKKMITQEDFRKGFDFNGPRDRLLLLNFWLLRLRSIYEELPTIQENHPVAGRLVNAMCPHFVKFKCITQEELGKLQKLS